MKEIKIKVSDRGYKYWLVMLRTRYGSKRAGLARLVELAILETVADQARRELEEAEAKL